MTPETIYQRFCKKRITTVTRLEYDNDGLLGRLPPPSLAKQFFQVVAKFFGQQPATKNVLRDEVPEIRFKKKLVIGRGESGGAVLNKTLFSTNSMLFGQVGLTVFSDTVKIFFRHSCLNPFKKFDPYTCGDNNITVVCFRARSSFLSAYIS